MAEVVGAHDPVGTGALIPGALIPYANTQPIRTHLKPVCCANDACKAVLGHTDGVVLVMGEIEVGEAVSIRHTRCGYVTAWSPGDLPPAPPRQIAAARALVPFHCRHKKCKGVVGFTDGARLVIGEAEISARTRFTHTRCRRASTWYPVA